MLLLYLAKRLFYMVVVFLIISVLLFAIYQFIPGDPVLRFMDPEEQRLPPEAFEIIYNDIRARLGLDRPVHIQYLRWMGNMLQGDFGMSLQFSRPVNEVLRAPVRVTLQMNLIIMVIVFLVSVPLGITSAVKKGGIYDNSIQTTTLLGFSLPIFILAILGVMIFAVWLGLTPVSGFGDPLFLIHNPDASAWEIFLDRLPFLALPVGVLSFAQLAPLTRIVRVSMIDALSQDYVRTARAKGLREGSVIYRHAFRNSLIPFVTSLVGWLIGLLTGSIVIETIFSLGGMGRLLINALQSLDYDLALAIQTIFILIALVGYLVVDFVYVLIDPRVRLD
ncbi:MAG: ABC transporter permease [Oscillospiraceae bacterium]|nr:ABC transporter permease [Oscillospiraceae bacterium]